MLARLPSEGASPRYRVKAATETFSRVALEHTMSAALSPEPARAAIHFPDAFKSVPAMPVLSEPLQLAAA